MKDRIHLRLTLSRRQLKVFLAAAIVLGTAYALRSESVTLTTLYPSPSGVYKKLVTTLDTILARDGGNVGIGTNNPQAKLHVVGTLRITDGLQSAGKVLTSDANGNTSWKEPAPDASPIICRAMRAINVPSPTVKYYTAGASFTAAECGGTLPDATYLGILREVGFCGDQDTGSDGSVHTKVIDAGTTWNGIAGPGVAIRKSEKCINTSNFTGEVAFIKRGTAVTTSQKYACGSCTLMAKDCQKVACGHSQGTNCATESPRTFGGTGTCDEPSSVYSVQSCSSGIPCGGTSCSYTTVSCTATNTPLP